MLILRDYFPFLLYFIEVRDQKLRKSQHPNFIFIITDGLFSLSEKRRIVENINYCTLKEINIIGIGVGISPFGIEKLFPNIVYSMNPDRLIQGISLCLSKITSNNIYDKIHVHK